MSVNRWKWIVAVALTTSCSSPVEAVSEPATSADQAPSSPVREIRCTAEAASRHVELHLRLSADGKLHEGTARRAYGQAADDARIRFDSVRDDGSHLAIDATESNRHYRFSIDKAAFDASRPHMTVDARVDDTDDPAITDAVEPFSCSLADAMEGFAIDGEDASRIFDSLRVEETQLPDGERVKVVDTHGGFRLYCSATAASTLCSLRIPALVTSVGRELVTYGYELDQAEAKALSAAIGDGIATSALHDAWNDEMASGAKMALACSGGGCTASYTIPDRFYAFVP